MFEEKITPRNLRPEFKRRIFFILMNFDLWWFLIWAYFNFSALSRDQDDRETCIKSQFRVKQGQTCRFGSIGIMIHETSSHDLSVNFNAFSFVGIRVTLVILVEEKRGLRGLILTWKVLNKPIGFWPHVTVYDPAERDRGQIG